MAIRAYMHAILNTVLFHNSLTFSNTLALAFALTHAHTHSLTPPQSHTDAYGQLVPDAQPWPLEAAHCATRILDSRVQV